LAEHNYFGHLFFLPYLAQLQKKIRDQKETSYTIFGDYIQEGEISEGRDGKPLVTGHKF
jgi:hypothetical protein